MTIYSLFQMKEINTRIWNIFTFSYERNILENDNIFTISNEISTRKWQYIYFFKWKY